VPPDVAAGLASAEGVRVHTVAIGTAGAPVAMEPPEAVRHLVRLERHDVDHESLSRIAAASGGRFFPARRSEELRAVYREIDALERVPRPLPPRKRSAPRPEPLLAAAGGLLLVELAAARVARRRLP
jgi:Ca-activated chloride channel family protein